MREAFIRTDTILDRILANTERELDEARRRVPLPALIENARQAAPPRPFTRALQRDTVALIAEVKHASPSKGVLIDPFDPLALATTYARNGAAAISVLTDQQFFQGHLDHLRAVRAAVSVPVLRKDFAIDAYQVYQGRAAGADAMLLIVAALPDSRLADLHALITGLGMAALVEVHNEEEMERALLLNPPLIGVNNRDLRTFQVDLQTTARLIGMAPAGAAFVAESGISSPEDVDAMGRLGAHAVLVGEALVKAGADLGDRVKAFSSRRRKKQV